MHVTHSAHSWFRAGAHRIHYGARQRGRLDPIGEYKDCSILYILIRKALLLTHSVAAFADEKATPHSLFPHLMQTTNACEAGADMLELNLSCPHGMGERGMGMVTGL